jgi:hypothetical protein
MTHPIVFISYSHDNDPHRQRVLDLSERLRRDGYETRLDRYVNNDPPEGVPRIPVFFDWVYAEHG